MINDNFWGAVTSSVDWCEKNYAVTPYLAEFWNSVSSLAMIFLGEFAVALNKPQDFSLKLAFRLISVVGIGSFLFHGTLKRETQALDEVPMVYAAITLLYKMLSSRYGYHLRLGWAAIVYSIVLTALVVLPQGNLQFFFFQTSFIILELVSIYLIYRIYRDHHTKFPIISTLFATGIGLYFAAVIVWLIDFRFCSFINRALPFNPQLHAIWHILASLGLYYLIFIVMLDSLIREGLKPFIDWPKGLVPVLHRGTVE